MIIKQEIPFDNVVLEWLQGEWHKKDLDTVRYKYASLIENPDPHNELENIARLNLMGSIRYDVINPLLQLSFKWHLADIENLDEFGNLSIITSGDWYQITNKKFKLIETPQNLHYHTWKEKYIRKKKEFFEKNGTFYQKLIVVGSNDQNLTIIEGNHRAVAYMLHGQENGFDFLPLEVILGISPYISQYRWSTEWIGMPWLIQECEKELKNTEK